MNRKPALIAASLVGIGVIAGVILVTAFSNNSLSNIFAANLSEIGAKKAPIQIGENVKMLNDAFVAASKAVSETVVSINVVTEKKAPKGQLQQFFRFFGDPRNQGQDGEEEDGEDMGIERGAGSGSGVIITQDGFIVTNNHVVEDAKSDGIRVILSDKREYKAKLVGRDPLTDLAVIKVDANSLPVAYLGSTDEIQVGEWVIAVGNPLGLRSTVTQGIISAVGRGMLGLSKDPSAVENFIQTDAAINPGNSGGGLFTLSGSLIGINSAIATRTGYYQGYGFAIPVDIVRSVALDLINSGKVNRAYLGVSIKTVDEKDSKGLGLSKPEGVLVQDVLANSPAKKAGIESGDVLLELDGTALNSSNQLQSLVVLRKPGEKVNLKIFRDGKTLNKTVVLQPKEGGEVSSNDVGSKGDAPDHSSSESNQPVNLEQLGFSVAPLTEEAKKESDVSNGVLVTKVANYGEARSQGLQSSAIIVSADRKPVTSTQQLKKLIESKKPGEVVLLKVKNKDRSQVVPLEIPERKN